MSTIDPTKLISPERFKSIMDNPPDELKPICDKVRASMAGLDQLKMQHANKLAEAQGLREMFLRQEGAVAVLQQLLAEQLAELDARRQKRD